MTQKKLLVTGAAGFIGSRFVASCRQRGLDVISVDAAQHFPARLEHSTIDYGEILDRDVLLEKVRAEMLPPLAGIVHLGACTDTTEMRVDYLTKLNLEYSKALWSYATSHQLKFVYASSAATYGDGAFGYVDDESKISKLQPLNPYGESKQAFDLWALAQERAGVHPPAWSGFKFFNVYGYGERHKGKMSSVVIQAFDQIRTTGKTRLFRSHRAGIADGHQSRDFIYVDDVVKVLHFALEAPLARGIFNLGTGQARTFLDLVRAVFAALGQPEQIEFVDTPEAIRERYQYFTEASMQRLRDAGYRDAFTSLEDGVHAYVAELQKKS